MASESRPEALVDTNWLAQHLDDPSVRVVEVDVDTTLYDKAHIPGSVGWNWSTELNDPVRRDIADAEQFGTLLGRSGITPDTTVVLYGDNNNWFAAFAAWILRYYGHDRVKLLDGGRRKWEADGRELAEEKPLIQPTTYEVAGVREELRAKRDEVIAAARKLDRPLVDVRSPDEYSGKILAPPGMQETALRGGHIPGAVNVPWAKAVQEDGTFKGLDELKALYADALQHTEPITYCRIGERSSHTWFVLHDLLGVEGTKNYDGSWTEYGNLVGVPIATGEQP